MALDSYHTLISVIEFYAGRTPTEVQVAELVGRDPSTVYKVYKRLGIVFRVPTAGCCWETLPWLPGYEISDVGEVRRTEKMRHGSHAGTIVPQALDGDDYRVVRVYDRNRKKHITLRVARLVCEAFYGPPPASYVACHNNGDLSDNRVSNLRWDTQKGNIADKIKHGTEQIGERSSQATLTDAQVRDIRIMLSQGLSNATIARRFSVATRLIWRIRHGETWSKIV